MSDLTMAERYLPAISPPQWLKDSLGGGEPTYHKNSPIAWVYDERHGLPPFAGIICFVFMRHGNDHADLLGGRKAHRYCVCGHADEDLLKATSKAKESFPVGSVTWDWLGSLWRAGVGAATDELRLTIGASSAEPLLSAAWRDDVKRLRLVTWERGLIDFPSEVVLTADEVKTLRDYLDRLCPVAATKVRAPKVRPIEDAKYLTEEASGSCFTSMAVTLYLKPAPLHLAAAQIATEIKPIKPMTDAKSQDA